MKANGDSAASRMTRPTWSSNRERQFPVTSRGMEMFTQSLDWGNEILASLFWVLKAWAIGAVALVAVAGGAGPHHHMGPSVLAGNQRLFRWAPKHSGVGDCSGCCCSR